MLHKLKLLWPEFLMKTGLSRHLILQRDGYRLRFFNSAYSRTFYIDPCAGRSDEWVLEQLLRNGDVFVDVGANVGSLSLKAASLVGANGRVFCFEPHPRIFSYLQENIELNAFAQMTACQLALGESDGTARLGVPVMGRSDDQSYISSGHSHGFEVQVRRLDDVLEDVSHIALLKVDTEGFEFFVFSGAHDVLGRTDAVFFESDLSTLSRSSKSRDDVLKLISRFGFQHFYLAVESDFTPYEADTAPTFANILALKEPLEDKTMAIGAEQDGGMSN